MDVIYDPAVLSEAQAIALAERLGCTGITRGVPPRHAGVELPPEGYVVVRERADGVDVLPAPTAEDVAALPEPAERKPEPEPLADAFDVLRAAVAERLPAVEEAGGLEALGSEPVGPAAPEGRNAVIDALVRIVLARLE
jgi:hypothetical protein